MRYRQRNGRGVLPLAYGGVLAAAGSLRGVLRSIARRGGTVTITSRIEPGNMKLRTIQGGWPRVVMNGRSTGLSNEKNSAQRKPHRVNELLHAPEGTRTPNLLIRSQMLYPIELRALDKIADCGLSYNGRYKTRTCDLHDVNVAL